MELFTLQALWAFLAIIMIDIVLAGDNALVIGMAANKLPDIYASGQSSGAPSVLLPFVLYRLRH